MRDKLIELIKEYICSLRIGDGAAYFLSGGVPDLADHLIANGVIVLPCKVGDRVYYLTSVDTEKELNIADIFCGTVKSVAFDGKNIWISVKYTNGLYYCHKSQEFGRDVFLTKDEAKKVLAERR